MKVRAPATTGLELRVHQSSGFLNRVPWFDSGRGHFCETLSADPAFTAWSKKLADSV
jgi:hypothetical protein